MHGGWEMNLVALGAVLLSVFLLGVAALVWQQVRGAGHGPAVYILEEAVPFVFSRLSDDAKRRLDQDDVLRILEWEIRYLQGAGAASGGPTTAGGDEAVRFICQKSTASGHPYFSEDVGEVLAHEADYLVEIGAVGRRVVGEEA